MLYIYGLTDPRNNQLRYIGMTKNLSRRLNKHIRAIKETSRKVSWIKSLLSENLFPEMFVIEECDENQWQDAEKFWISYFKYIGADLTNMTDGGDSGFCMMEESKEKLRKANLGKKYSEETKAKRAMLTIGRKHSSDARAKMSVYAKNRTSEHREKLIASNIGRVRSESSRERIRKALPRGERHVFFGKTLSEEHRKKIGEAHLGIVPDEETRLKMRNAKLGTRIPEKTKEKMRIAQQERRKRESLGRNVILES